MSSRSRSTAAGTASSSSAATRRSVSRGSCILYNVSCLSYDSHLASRVRRGDSPEDVIQPPLLPTL